MVCWPFTSSPYRRYENDHCNRIYDDGGHWIKRPGVRPPRAGGCRPRCWGRRSADRSRPEGSPRSRAWCRAPCRAAMPWGGDAPPAVDDLADRRHRRALPYPSRRVWTCQTSQIWYAPMSPKQSDFDSETAFIPHLSITQPDWNMNSTMSAYDIRLKPVRRGAAYSYECLYKYVGEMSMSPLRQVNSSLPRLLTVRNPEGPFYWRTRPVWPIATVVR